MTLAEARTVVEKAFPGQGVQLVSSGGVCSVVHPKDGVLGKAFSWRPALQEACKPLLAVADKARLVERERQAADFMLFQEFMREKLAGEFEDWKNAKRAIPANTTALVAPSDAGGDTPDPKQLVQVVSR